ncbi:MAG: MFS transporter [Erysipelotrichaceae bacterium]|nr:MFS transporter [Erysipelotrichaceae bacterium]
MEKKKAQKLSALAKYGYAVGGMTDTLSYDFPSTFLLFFLTDCAGLSAAFAATVVTVGSIFDVVTDPIVGAFCNKLKKKMGGMRRWLPVAVVFYVCGYYPLFSVLNFSQTGKFIWYLGFYCIYWIGYKLYNIPYYSMTITEDNTERSQIRLIAQILQYIAVFLSCSAPAAMVAMMKNGGIPETKGWMYVAWIEATCAIITILTVYFTTKGAEIDIETEAEEEKKNVLAEFADIMKERPFAVISISCFLYRLSYSLFLIVSTYYIFHSLNMSEWAYSGFNLIVSFGGMAVMAILIKVIEKQDKVKILIACLLFSGTIVCLFSGFKTVSVAMLFVLGALYTIGDSAYWGMNYSVLYDCYESDEFEHGRRRESSIYSLYSMLQKLSYTVAAALVGVVLTKIGYDETLGAGNAQATLDGIRMLFCFGTGGPAVLAALLMCLNPLKKEKYTLLLKQLEAKRAGKPFSTNGLKGCVSEKFYEEHLSEEKEG